MPDNNDADCPTPAADSEPRNFDPDTDDSLGGPIPMYQHLKLRRFPVVPAKGYVEFENDYWNSRARAGGRRVSHQALDIIADLGDPIIAITNMKIRGVGWNELGGWYVTATTVGNRFYWLHYFAHMERPSHLRPGEFVSGGSLLGFVGKTGGSKKPGAQLDRGTPPHLHWSLKEGLRTSNEPPPYVNPYWSAITAARLRSRKSEREWVPAPILSTSQAAAEASRRAVTIAAVRGSVM